MNRIKIILLWHIVFITCLHGAAASAFTKLFSLPRLQSKFVICKNPEWRGCQGVVLRDAYLLRTTDVDPFFEELHEITIGSLMLPIVEVSSHLFFKSLIKKTDDLAELIPEKVENCNAYLLADEYFMRWTPTDNSSLQIVRNLLKEISRDDIQKQLDTERDCFIIYTHPTLLLSWLIISKTLVVTLYKDAAVESFFKNFALINNPFSPLI